MIFLWSSFDILSHNAVDLQFLDTFEAFLDVLVDFTWILRITQNLKQIIIWEEIESREFLSVSLEQLEQDLLALIEFFAHF